MKNKNSLNLVYGFLIVTFFQGLIHNLGHPVTPDFIKGLRFQNEMFGYFFAAMNLGLVVGSPLFGFLGDRFPRKWFVFFGMFFYGVFQAAFGLIHFSPYLMILFRFFAGFFVSAPATLLLAEVIGRIDGPKRVTVLSALIALNTLGASLSYQIGGWLGTILNGQSIVFVIQSLANTVFAFAILLFLKFKSQEHTTPLTKHRFKLSSIRQVRSFDRRLMIFFVLIFFIHIAFINVSKYLDVLIVNDLKYTSSQLGTFVMVTGVVAMLTNLILVPIVIKANKNQNYIKVMLVIASFSLGLTFVFGTRFVIVLLYSVFMMYVVSKSIIIPLEQGHIASFANEKSYGTIMGVRQLIISMGSIIGPIVGGYLYAGNPYLVFWVSIGILFVSYFVLQVSSILHNKHLHKIKA